MKAEFLVVVLLDIDEVSFPFCTKNQMISCKQNSKKNELRVSYARSIGAAINELNQAEFEKKLRLDSFKSSLYRKDSDYLYCFTLDWESLLVAE